MGWKAYVCHNSGLNYSLWQNKVQHTGSTGESAQHQSKGKIEGLQQSAGRAAAVLARSCGQHLRVTRTHTMHSRHSSNHVQQRSRAVWLSRTRENLMLTTHTRFRLHKSPGEGHKVPLAELRHISLTRSSWLCGAHTKGEPENNGHSYQLKPFGLVNKY